MQTCSLFMEIAYCMFFFSEYIAHFCERIHAVPTIFGNIRHLKFSDYIGVAIAPTIALGDAK